MAHQVQAALRAGRAQVAHALELGHLTGHEPDEETLTWILCTATASASTRVIVRRFTRREENRHTGADWLWWWVGSLGSFGSLVQAKRLKRHARGVSFDYAYRPQASSASPEPPRQIDRLLSAAGILEVPAAYALYQARTLPSPERWHCAEQEPVWPTSATTFIPAAVVHNWLATPDLADYSLLRPIDCMACPGTCGNDAAVLQFYVSRFADEDVAELLALSPADLAVAAARAMLIPTVRMRLAQFRAAQPRGVDVTHTGFALGQDVRRGFRQETPWYVMDAMEGRRSNLDDVAAGTNLDDLEGVIVVTND